MKKILISVVLLLALLMCITACGGQKPPVGGGGNPPSVYEALDALAGQSYAKVTAEIVTQTEGVQLAAKYVLTQSNVQYSIEQLNLLPENGDVTNLVSSYKSKIEGSAAINNGEIVLDGASVSLPSYDVLKGAFKFSESNFANVEVENDFFEADVVSPSAFYDATANVQNMKVSVEYTQTALAKIVVAYQAASTAVTATYTFEI